MHIVYGRPILWPTDEPCAVVDVSIFHDDIDHVPSLFLPLDIPSWYSSMIQLQLNLYMSHRKNPGNTKYVLDGHWFMEIDGNC